MTVEGRHGGTAAGYRGDDRRPVDDDVWAVHWFAGGSAVLLACVVVVTVGAPGLVLATTHQALAIQTVLAVIVAAVALAHHHVTGRAPERGLGVAAILLALQGMATALGAHGDVLVALGIGAACVVGHAVWGPEVDAGARFGWPSLVACLGVGAALAIGTALPGGSIGTVVLLVVEVALWAFVAGLGFARARARGWGFLAWGAWMAVALAADDALRAAGHGSDVAITPAWLAVTGLAVAAFGGLHETARVARARRGDALGHQLTQHADAAMFETAMRAMRHEIRNAVVAIDGAAMTMTLSGDRLSPEDRQRLQRTFQASLDGLRSLADPVSAVPSREYQLDEVVAARADVASVRGICVDGVWTDPVVVTGDRSPVARLVDNLILNAQRHGEAGTDAHPVVVRLVEEEGQARVLVMDDGPGVPVVDRARIFEAGQRVRDDLPGDGLGLSIARDIARGQGGDITYEPRQGGGACFVLTLPVARRSAVPGRGPRRHEVEDGGQPLYVEDRTTRR